MGRPGRVAYRGRHGYPRPASGPARPLVRPPPVVATGLAPGPVAGRGHPGSAPRAARGGGRQRRVLASSAGGAELDPGVADPAAQPGGRVLRGPGAHRDAEVPAAGRGRGGDTAPTGHRAPLERGLARLVRPVSGHLAPARLPSGGRPAAGGRRGRRRRDVAGGSAVHPGVRLRVDATTEQPAGPRPVVAPGPPPPDAARPGGRLADRGRARAAGRGAPAHRRGRVARRRGRAGAAGPQPHAATGTPGGAPNPDPDRRGRRRRRRAAPAGAGPARRYPAAAGRAGHEPGPGPDPGPDRRAGAAGPRRGPRGRQDRAGRAPEPDPRPAPGRAGGPRPGRGPVGHRRADADPGPADRGPAAAPGRHDRGGRLLRSLRDPDQHHQARPGQPGGGGRAAGRRPAAHHRQRRRRGRC
jgi:hypothetical protein